MPHRKKLKEVALALDAVNIKSATQAAWFKMGITYVRNPIA